jgi:hypothetical protein
MKQGCFLLACMLIAFSLVSSVVVLGQSTDLGTIRGTVTDASGALVPNARVTITHQATGTPRTTTSNSHGEYQIFGLPSGVYKVTISMQGMATHDITGVKLNGSDVVSANAVLKVSSAKEEVLVTAEAPTINTADQTISDTISNREVIDLPRDSRDSFSFLYLNPNITQSNETNTYKFWGSRVMGRTSQSMASALPALSTVHPRIASRRSKQWAS